MITENPIQKLYGSFINRFYEQLNNSNCNRIELLIGGVKIQLRNRKVISTMGYAVIDVETRIPPGLSNKLIISGGLFVRKLYKIGSLL